MTTCICMWIDRLSKSPVGNAKHPTLTLSLEAWLIRIIFVSEAEGGYLGIFRSSARTQMARDRRATEPDWWVAASGVGT